MRKLTVISFLLIAAIVPTLGADDKSQATGSISWLNSIDMATTQARATGKPILLYLTADYCAYCKQMDKEAFVDSRAVLLSQLYIPCKMDGEHEGKPLIKKYDVKTYPYEAVVDDAGALLAPAPEYMDPDKYARTLATDLPDASLSQLKTQTDPTSMAVLAVIDAERGDTDAAEAIAAALNTDGLPASVALNHAIGSAYVDAKAFDKALKPLSTAAASLGDCHEAVGIHFHLADCYHSLTRPVDEASELAAIRQMHAASKDEKKLAEKRQRGLSSGAATK